MKLFITILILLVIPSWIFASSTSDNAGLLPQIVIPALGIITALIGVLSRFIKLPGLISSTAKKIHKNVITFERIDKAVEELLSRGNPPSAFVDWLGDVVASIVVYAPAWTDMTIAQRTEVLSSLFAKLSFSKAKRVMPVSDTEVLKRSFSRQRAATQVIRKSNGRIPVRLDGK